MSSSGLDCPYYRCQTITSYLGYGRTVPYPTVQYTAVYNTAVYYTVFWPYPTVRYGTVYGRILGEDTVRYGRNLKLRLRSIPTPSLNRVKVKGPGLECLKVGIDRNLIFRLRPYRTVSSPRLRPYRIVYGRIVYGQKTVQYTAVTSFQTTVTNYQLNY